MRGPRWEWRCFFTIPQESSGRSGRASLLTTHPPLEKEPEVRSDVYIASNGCVGAKLRGGSQLEVKLCVERNGSSESYQKVVLKTDGTPLSQVVHSIDTALSSWADIVLADGQPASSPKHRCPVFCPSRIKAPSSQQEGSDQSLALLIQLHKERHHVMVEGHEVEQTDMHASYAWVPQVGQRDHTSNGIDTPQLSSLAWQKHPVQYRSLCVESVALEEVRSSVGSVMDQVSPSGIEGGQAELRSDAQGMAWLSLVCDGGIGLQPGCGIFGYPSFVAELAASITTTRPE